MDRTSRIILIVGLGLFALIVVQVYQEIKPKSKPLPPVEAKQYAAQVLQHRTNRNRYLKQDSRSPMPPAIRSRFNALPYYGVDTAWRKAAQWEPTPRGQVSWTADSLRMEVAGTLRFTHAGNTYSLLAYHDDPKATPPTLYVPFQDATSGQGTYGGGRIVNLELRPGEVQLLDFNYALNPTCAYDPTFICPIPPAANRLPIAVEAGERDFPLGAH
jgi:uncharacterized protein (DUF1684 family)